MSRVGVLAVAVVFVAACGSSSKPSARSVTGAVTTSTGQTARPAGGACTQSGVGDIDAGGGTQVTVKDAAGKVVGVATLAAGTDGGMHDGNAVCSFAFTVERVPDAEFYEISVGAHAPVRVARADVAHVTVPIVG